MPSRWSSGYLLHLTTLEAYGARQLLVECCVLACSRLTSQYTATTLA